MATLVGSPQHFIECQFCNQNVTFFCKPCQVRLCENCVGRHLTTKTLDEHKKVYYSQRNAKSPKDPKVINSIKSGYGGLFDVCYSGPDRFYLCSHVAAEIAAFDVAGKKISTFNTPHLAGRLADSADGILFANYDSKNVYKLTGGKPRKIFTTDFAVWGIAVTDFGDILLALAEYDISTDTYRGKVVVCSNTGSVERTIEYHNNRRLYGHPHSIAENKGGDICVADVQNKAVIVVDQLGEFRFSYHGQGGEFIPNGLCTDSQRHIIITDDNDKLHVISANGQFIRYLQYKGISHPMGISINSQDQLLVCEFLSGLVKVIQYMN